MNLSDRLLELAKEMREASHPLSRRVAWMWASRLEEMAGEATRMAIDATIHCDDYAVRSHLQATDGPRQYWAGRRDEAGFWRDRLTRED